MAFNIRDATDGDLSAILEIYNDQILNGTATFHTEIQTLAERALWLQKLRAERYPCIVAEVTEDATGAKRTIGWANLWHFKERQAYDGSAELSLYVHKDFRGKGVGEKLLQGLLEETRRQGTRFHTIISVVTTENERTINFWQKQGFKLCGTLREVGYKFGRWLDVAYLQIFL
ncbi:GCN5-related N-acetyltransferase [Trametes coccinea BRFM310]|uniref:GCN5-related N-acetyltransferase n=1 Tax=Trametes coccinea (strain BRFM310) TaxID=1353009 RepID=A0A1Y2IWP2_TRAC3|nr:GCN5-related N-acetyltransferase [Trametes coccinea BRFM310]